MPTVNGKEIKLCASQGFNAAYGGMEGMLYTQEALAALVKHPVDMLVFEMENEHTMVIRSAGYRLDIETIEPDEKTILFRTESLEIRKFWFKIDDYGEYYVGTFLFPEEY